MKRVQIQTRSPRGNDPGAVEVSHYIVKDNDVILTNEKGVYVDRYKYARKLKPGEDAHAVAAVLLRQLAKPRGNSFHRKIAYPKVGF